MLLPDLPLRRFLEFSAAFSGGPIEASAARPDARRRAAFSAAFSGGPIEAKSLLDAGVSAAELIFRCF